MRPANTQHPTCAPDCDHYEYDVWGETDDGSLEGSEDGDLY